VASKQLLDALLGKIQVEPSTLGLETLQLEVDFIQIQEWQVTIRPEVALFTDRDFLGARSTGTRHRLDPGVPIENNPRLEEFLRRGPKFGLWAIALEVDSFP
jgi:hypothetical protein